MVQNFGNLASHRLYVLALFRYTLRNANRRCSSVHLRNRIQKVVKTVIWKHRYDKSSWSIYSLLRQLTTLNEHLNRGEVGAVWPMLTAFSKRQKSPHGSPLIEPVKQLKHSNRISIPKNIEEDREQQVLARYVNHRAGRNRLPHNVTEEYKKKLLLPIALHENAMLKLTKVQHQLSKGPPKVFLSHTSAGPSRIWFIRSALNRSKRQSKPLGTLIRQEKKWSQKTLNDLERCKQNAVWALEEAIWEQIQQDGTCLHRDVGKHLTKMKLPSEMRRSKQDPEDELTTLQQWLVPIKDVMNSLTEKQQERIEYYKKFKINSLVHGGNFGYWERKSCQMYNRRVERFKTLVGKDMQQVVPFLRGRDLPSLLRKYKL